MTGVGSVAREEHVRRRSDVDACSRFVGRVASHQTDRQTDRQISEAKPNG